MKVSELPYRRYTFEEASAVLQDVTARVKNAQNVEEILAAREDYLKAFCEYMTESALANVRYTLDTTDAFYQAEMGYYDEIGPRVEQLAVEYAAALLDSPFRPELEKRLNPVLFRTLEVQRKATSPLIVEDMVEENRLVREYSDLMSALTYEFRGEKLTQSQLLAYARDDDRDTRRACFESLGRTLEAHKAELDGIYDRMVKVRDRMAKKLGMKNYIELGYYRMGRLCFDQEKVAVFRENVLRDLVPVVARLRTENAKRLGIEDYKLYDDGVILPGGSPKPGNKDAIFTAATEMYHAMSPETAAFIDCMMENDAFDVESRKNKWGGGYMSEFPKYKQPFIFANFNGTSGDVDVMTHEAGHAFNGWLIADNPYALELQCGGMETAETHSMSMEFFAWPYMEKFFGPDAEKYKYVHTLESLSFIPYGTMVDAFQHLVYEKPELTPEERDALWLELEGRFRPYLSMAGIPYLEKGTRWQYQMHIYEMPFYYIDYCLAQSAAFLFLLESREDYDDAFARYLRFSRHGGEMVWTDLMAEAGLPNPFEPGALKALAARVEALLGELRKDL